MELATAELSPRRLQRPLLLLKQLGRRDLRRATGFDDRQEGLAAGHLALVLGEGAAGAVAGKAPDLQLALGRLWKTQPVCAKMAL